MMLIHAAFKRTADHDFLKHCATYPVPGITNGNHKTISVMTGSFGLGFEPEILQI
jgi:hypothetical protein